MKYPRIFSDIDINNENFPPDMADLVLESDGSRCFGVIYKPRGQGPHPTILLLHGFPGSERNFDLAQMFRRAGFNVIVFHYRGSWGSEGDFSFQNVLDDTERMIEMLLSDECARDLRIQKDSIILMGHSMGGFSALMNGSKNSSIKYVISIAGYNLGVVAKELSRDRDHYMKTKQMFEECIVPLKGTGVNVLFDEINGRKEDWDLNNLSFSGKDRNVLLIAGSRDIVSEPELHHDPLYCKLSSNAHDPLNVQQVILDATHSFHSKRVSLAEVILDWLSKRDLVPE